MTPAERVLLRCVPQWSETMQSNCLVWTGYKDAKGYGRMHANGRNGAKTHRVIYEELVRPLVGDETIDHLCFVKACQNVEHMEPVTRVENSIRGAERNPVVLARRAMSECSKGHAFTEANTYVHGGRRICITCQSETSRRYRERRSHRVMTDA